MNNKIKEIIPEYRFPEFVKSEGWSVKEFGALINILSDYTANGSFASLKDNVTYYSNEEYAVLVRTTDLDKKVFTPLRFTDKRGYEFLSKTSLFGNEIVMANVGSIGKVFRVPYYDKPMTLAPNTYVLKFNDFVDEDFIYQLMLRSEFEKKLLSMVGSSTLMAINKSNLRSIKVSIPEKNEQQKIASCLSSLDEVITANSQKLELLKDHKKGLMQNLFPDPESSAGGKKVPKFRFKEFEKDGEWVEKKLGEVAEIITGNTPSTNEPLYYGGDKMFVSPADISDKRIVSQTKTTLTDLGFSKTRQIKEGSVLFVCIGSTIGKIAQNKFDCATNQQLNSLIANKGYSNDFLYSILDANSSVIASIAGNHAVPIINKTTFSEVKFLFPKSLQEQQKIASCLSSLDALIAAQAEKIEQLKLHKKGLMQGLFPKIND